ncbi:MAG: glycosyltransferase [Actinobacteria bacterium]|nr:glycosyltransferase [Actinomycetota bacterium]
MTRKINILHTLGWLGFGGMEGGVIKLVNGLDRNIYTPHVVAISGFDENGRKALSPGVHFKLVKKGEGRDWSVVRRLAEYFRSQKIDIVHSHNWGTWLYSFLAARLARVPVFIHGEHGRDTEKAQTGQLRLMAEIILAWKANQLTTVSNDIAGLMSKKWHVGPNKIRVIHNGIDLERFYPPKNRNEAKTRIGIDEDVFLFGTVVGSFRPVKDLPTLFRAIEIVKRKHANVRLAIVGGRIGASDADEGNAKYFAELKALAEQLNLADAIKYYGPRDKVEQYMQAFDVYVNSSLYEGMSNTLLEAMGCGTPVVATNVGGTPDIIRSGFNGLLVPHKEPGKMAQALLAVLESSALCEELSKEGRRYVELFHRNENFIQEHEKMYTQLYDQACQKGAFRGLKRRSV